jgi:hypothetical protein
MSYRYLAKLAFTPLPSFVTRPSQLRRLRRLAQAGFVEARFYPARALQGQLCEVRALTATGRALLDEHV